LLWYKAWLETRSRFFIALTLCVVLCAQLVIVLSRGEPPSGTISVLNGVHATLVIVWSLSIVLLMMGGLLREKASGSVQYTLALPVSRLRLMLTRIGMGLVQSVALAILPWIAMLFAGRAAGKPIFISQAGFHVFLLLTGGAVFIALALLISCVVEGEYTAPIVSLGVIVMLAYALSSRSLSRYSPSVYMMGFPYLDRHTSYLAGPLPWLRAGLYMLTAVLLTGIAIRVIQKRDF